MNIINKVYQSRFINHAKKIYINTSINQQQKCLITNNSLKNSHLISEEDKTFKLTDYDCIGFDLDNTLCKYKVGPMIKMEYDIISNYLVEQKNYSPKYLLQPMEENVDFLIKGLLLDVSNGNLLKINSEGKIITASHGTKFLNKSDIEKQYGINKRWCVADAFVKDYLATWNGPLSEKMRALLDYFDVPAALAFARAVDTIDEIEGKSQKNYNIWPDLLAALIDMYAINNFQLNKGGYFPNLKSNPEQYIEKCSNNILNWLKSLKARNKILFLITGSYVDFANLTSEICMGEKWKDLFDIVIFYAKKPGFFTENRPFISVKTKNPILSNDLEKNGWYIQGNWKDLYKFLSTLSKKEKPRVAYIGDNLIQDIYTPAVFASCDTIAVCEELEAEGVFGFRCNHSDSKYLTSQRWGSFFSGNDDGEIVDTVWLNIMQKHAKLFVPSIDFLAQNPVDFEYKL